MYQRNTINNDNRKQFVTQSHYFTYQRKGNQELQIQLSNNIVADLQNQMNNLSSGGGEDPDIGTMCISVKHVTISFHIFTNMWMRIFVYIT